MTWTVVKLGGHALDHLEPSSLVLRSLASDVGRLLGEGHHVAVVHGGGPQIAELLDRVGEHSEFIDGLRVTSVEVMEIVAMALSWVNLKVTAAFETAGVRAVGLSGASGALLRSEAKPGPWGRVGGVVTVDAATLECLAGAGMVAVISPVALDDAGQPLNVNADAAAGAVAGALGADRLVMLSDVAQVRADPDDPATALRTVTKQQIEELVSSGAAREGMRPKLEAAVVALDAGARRVTLADGRRPGSLAEVLAGMVESTEVVSG